MLQSAYINGYLISLRISYIVFELSQCRPQLFFLRRGLQGFLVKQIDTVFDEDLQICCVD